MGFESTHMGMKFFNVQIPQLIDSINRVIKRRTLQRVIKLYY